MYREAPARDHQHQYHVPPHDGLRLVGTLVAPDGGPLGAGHRAGAWPRRDARGCPATSVGWRTGWRWSASPTCVLTHAEMTREGWQEDLTLLGTEMNWLTRELPEAESEITAAKATTADVESTLADALVVATHCERAWLMAEPPIRRQINRGFFEKLFIVEDGITLSYP
jgi:hypothetical protein